MRVKMTLLWFLFLFLLYGNAAYAEGNLVVTGGFETETGELPPEWKSDTYFTPQADVFFYLDDSNPYEGTYCAVIESRREDDSKLLQTIEVEPKTTYRFSCFIKAEGMKQENHLGANISLLDITATSRDLKETQGKWEYVELYGRTGKRQKSVTITLRLGGYGNLNEGKACFDNVRFVKVETVPENVRLVDFYAEKNSGQTRTQTPGILLSRILFFSLCFILFSIFVYRFLIPFFTTSLDQNKQLYFVWGACIGVTVLFHFFVASLIEGFPTDIACFRSWSEALLEHGFNEVYSSGIYIDYPPGYLYILYFLRIIAKWFTIAPESSQYLFLLKLPAVIADIVLSLIILRLSMKRLGAAAALGLSLLIALNPALIINSAGWGQIDSILILMLLLFSIQLYKHKVVAASIILAAAITVKPQAILFSPLLLFALLESRDFRKLGLCLFGFVITFILIILPFAVGKEPLWIIKLYLTTVNTYPYATVNAFNLYWLTGGNFAPLDQTFLFIPYTVWKAIFGLGIVFMTGWIFFRTKTNDKIFISALFLITAVFVLLPEMHERYLMPAVVFTLLSYLYTEKKNFFLLFTGFSLTLFINQAYVLAAYQTETLNLLSQLMVFTKGTALINVLLLGFLIYSIFFDTRREGDPPGIPVPNPFHRKGKSRWPGIDTSVVNPPPPLIRKEFVLIFSVVFIYSSFSLPLLGSRDTPISFWNPKTRNEYIIFDLQKETTINRMSYYVGMGAGTYVVEVSDDLKTWSKSGVLEQRNNFEMVEWRYIEDIGTTRYIRISASNPAFNLHEVVFYPEQGKLPIQAEILSFSNTIGKENGPLHIYDEQERRAFIPSHMNGMYFDEIYHARSAYDILQGRYPSEDSHPPLGKLIIAAGILLFDMTPFGWRFMGFLFGNALLVQMYFTGRLIFRNRFFAWIAALLISFDFMFFVQSRIATLDIFLTFFILSSFYFMFRYYTFTINSGPLRMNLLPLILTGCFWGFSVAVKWSGIYPIAGLLVLFIFIAAFKFSLFREAKNRSHSIISGKYKKVIIMTIGAAVISFVIIPISLYAASYIPLHLHGEGFPDKVDRSFLEMIRENQKSMYNYHSGLEAEHPFSSFWWQWPIIERPVWLYSGGEHLADGKVASIVSMGNPAIWWMGTCSIILILLYRPIKEYGWPGVVLVALFSNYLPWGLAPRSVTYIYHFFPSVPFLILTVLFVFRDTLSRGKNGLRLTIVYAAAVFALFLLFYPVLSGMQVSQHFVRTFLRWIDSWVFFF